MNGSKLQLLPAVTQDFIHAFHLQYGASLGGFAGFDSGGSFISTEQLFLCNQQVDSMCPGWIWELQLHAGRFKSQGRLFYTDFKMLADEGRNDPPEGEVLLGPSPWAVR